MEIISINNIVYSFTQENVTITTYYHEILSCFRLYLLAIFAVNP